MAFLDDPARVVRLLELLDAGARTVDIAAEFGVSNDTISRARHALGRRAANHHYDPDRIVALRDAGRSYEEICAELDVSVQTVWRVLRRAGRVGVREPPPSDDDLLRAALEVVERAEPDSPLADQLRRRLR